MEKAIIVSDRRANLVQLKPLDSPELIQLAAGWLAQKENYQWLDFGAGRQIISPEWLKIMNQRGTHVIRVYTSDDVPTGVVGLEDVSFKFKTARIWIAAGDKSFQRRGYATRAASKMLTAAYRDLGLLAVNAWVVEHNPSIRILQRLNFNFIGRQRQCHDVDGHMYDRLWFDLLASEHTEIRDV